MELLTTFKKAVLPLNQTQNSCSKKHRKIFQPSIKLYKSRDLRDLDCKRWGQ
jgi:hypothetical protein